MVTNNAELKPEIAAAFARLGARLPTAEDIVIDRKPESQTPSAKEIVSLSQEDSVTHSRIQKALIDMEARGYKYSSTYNRFLDLLDNIESGAISGEAAFAAFTETVVKAQDEMATTPPPSHKERMTFKTTKRRFFPDLPGLIQGLIGKKARV